MPFSKRPPWTDFNFSLHVYHQSLQETLEEDIIQTGECIAKPTILSWLWQAGDIIFASVLNILLFLSAIICLPFISFFKNVSNDFLLSVLKISVDFWMSRSVMYQIFPFHTRLEGRTLIPKKQQNPRTSHITAQMFGFDQLCSVWHNFKTSVSSRFIRVFLSSFWADVSGFTIPTKSRHFKDIEAL